MQGSIWSIVVDLRNGTKILNFIWFAYAKHICADAESQRTFPES